MMVMMHHYSQYVCANHLSDSLIFKILSYQGGYLGVAIFFLLSGYGLMESDQKQHLQLGKFFKRRFLKIYLPVLAVTLLWIITSQLLLAYSPFKSLACAEGGGVWVFLTDFGDGALWFVKVLIVLYAMFYLYTLLLAKVPKASLPILITMTLLMTVGVNVIMADSQAISVPFFFLGVVLSQSKHHKDKSFLICVAIISITLIFQYLFIRHALWVHSIINGIVIANLIAICSYKEISIKIPAVLGTISFDLYLIHNKVLMSLKGNLDYVSIWAFLFLTITCSAVFYQFRTKLLKI